MFKWYLRRLPYYKTEGFSAWELHHGYYGLILMLVGFITIFDLWPWYIWIITPEWVTYICLFMGLWLFADDVYQHILQKNQMKKEGHYDIVTFFNWFPYKLIGRIFMPY